MEMHPTDQVSQSTMSTKPRGEPRIVRLRQNQNVMLCRIIGRHLAGCRRGERPDQESNDAEHFRRHADDPEGMGDWEAKETEGD